MASIDINTAQHVTIAYELASVRNRISSALIDAAVLGVVYLALYFSTAWLFEGELLPIAKFFPIWGTILYIFLCEWLWRGKTLGKRSVGTHVMRADGQECTVGDYFLRAVFTVVDYLLTGFSLGIIIITVSEKKQRLGDMAAGTVVVKRQPNDFSLEKIVQIRTLDTYTPQYPAVKNLAERDILLVKTLLDRHKQYPNKAHFDLIDTTAQTLENQLHIKNNTPQNPILFLKTLIDDYIVLTR